MISGFRCFLGGECNLIDQCACLWHVVLPLKKDNLISLDCSFFAIISALFYSLSFTSCSYYRLLILRNSSPLPGLLKQSLASVNYKYTSILETLNSFVRVPCTHLSFTIGLGIVVCPLFSLIMIRNSLPTAKLGWLTLTLILFLSVFVCAFVCVCVKDVPGRIPEIAQLIGRILSVLESTERSKKCVVMERRTTNK